MRMCVSESLKNECIVLLLWIKGGNLFRKKYEYNRNKNENK